LKVKTPHLPIGFAPLWKLPQRATAIWNGRCGPGHSQLLSEMKVPKRERAGRALELYLTSLGWWMVSGVVSEKDIRPVIESVLARAAA